MAKVSSKKAVKNIVFGQTGKALKALRYTRVTSGFQRNIPYRVNMVSRMIINGKVMKIKKSRVLNPLPKIKKYSKKVSLKKLKKA